MSDFLLSPTLRVESDLSSLRRPAPRPDGGAVGRAAGAGLLAIAALAALGLMTWSASDPSLTYHSTAKPTNALGTPGAIVSDMIMTTLGLAGVLALLPPFYWALQLLTDGRINGFKTKLILTPIAVLALAAFLSALGRTTYWPLPAGYGGLVGDMLFAALTGAIAAAGLERAGLAAALVAGTAGTGLLTLALGLTFDDMKAMVRRAKRAYEPDSRWVSHLKNATGPIMEMPVAAPRGEPRPAQSTMTSPQMSPTPELQPDWTHYHGAHRHELRPQTAAAPSAAPVMSPRPVAPPTLPPVETLSALPPGPVDVATPAVREPARPTFRCPPTSLLPRTSAQRASALETGLADKLRADRLRDVLAEFSVLGTIREHLTGPVLTTFVFEPQAGTRTTRVLGMAGEIAAALGVPAVRLQLADGRSTLMIEVPHDDAVAVGIRDLVEHAEFQRPDSRLPLALGATARGEPVVLDLAELPSLLIAGTHDEERHAALRAITVSLIQRHTPDRLQLALADAAGGLGGLAALPHCAGHPPAVGPAEAVDLLSWAAQEIDARTVRLKSAAHARTIETYNTRVAQAGRDDLMPYLVLIVTDLSAVALVEAPAFEYALHRIVRDGAAVGVHLVAGTARVDAVGFPDAVRTAFATRLAFKLPSRPDSRAVLDDMGAEYLLGQGDALAWTARDHIRRVLGGGALSRLHTTRISLEAAFALSEAVTVQPQAPVPVAAQRVPLWQPAPSRIDDVLYDRAVALVRREQSADPTVLRRGLALSYGDALSVIEQLARDHIVSAPDASGLRRVLIGRAA